MGRLISKNSAILKPQNRISDRAKIKSIDEIQEWLKAFDLPAYQARLLAVELIDRAISDRIRKTAFSAAEVYLSDAAKIESLTMSARRIAGKLDESDELDKLLGKLCDDDSQNEGNSQ